MFGLENLFQKAKSGDETSATLAKDEIVNLLKTTPEALDAFERSYQVNVMSFVKPSGNMFDVNAKQASAMRDTADIQDEAKRLNDRIIGELMAMTPVWTYDGRDFTVKYPEKTLGDGTVVTAEDIMAIPMPIRPQLSGTLMTRDVSTDSGPELLFLLKHWMEADTKEEKEKWYHLFRQGLDILDLDALTYEMLGMNRNSIGHWLPGLCHAVKNQEFFKVPKTKVIKVPLPLLQLTRMQYERLTPGTFDIVDRFCQQVFELDESKKYFIKTGTYSSKFDFRNAKVSGADEVRELGEYLLYIQYQAQQMAAPMSSPSIYGASTTNEWVVREYIEDVENNPCIYKGLPLRTEYRVFVDIDRRAFLGVNPYWDPEIMKRRFGHASDSNDPHQVHDYITYSAHEEKLMERYERNKNTVTSHILSMLRDMRFAGMYGQWAIDVMQNGDDFYIIDMGLAQNSALRKCVLPERLRFERENWLPKLPPA